MTLFEEAKAGKVCPYVTSKQEYDHLMSILDGLGYMWLSGSRMRDPDYFTGEPLYVRLRFDNKVTKSMIGRGGTEHNIYVPYKRVFCSMYSELV